MIIDFVRHGQSEGNLKKIIQGQYDLPLTEQGKEQAKTLGNILDKDYSRAFSSPLSRAFETAKIALESAGLNLEIKPMDELMEMNFGIIQGQPFREDDEAIKETFKKGKSDLNFRFEGGESGFEFVERIKKGIDHITSSSQNEDKIFVVSHGGFIQTFNRIYLGLNEKVVPNVQVSRFSYSDGKFTKL